MCHDNIKVKIRKSNTLERKSPAQRILKDNSQDRIKSSIPTNNDYLVQMEVRADPRLRIRSGLVRVEESSMDLLNDGRVSRHLHGVSLKCERLLR